MAEAGWIGESKPPRLTQIQRWIEQSSVRILIGYRLDAAMAFDRIANVNQCHQLFPCVP